MTRPLLELQGVHVALPMPDGSDVLPLQGVDLHVGRGQTVGLVGESGSGKSMTARTILSLLPPGGRVTEGDVRWNGGSVLEMTRERLRWFRGSEVAMVFQDPVGALNPMLTVERQIVDAYEANRQPNGVSGRDVAVDALARLDIPQPAAVLGLYPHQLSGGMAQRVNIAMALVCRPDLLLADEPTTGLDVTTQLQVLDLLEDRVKAEDAALLLISHDLRVVSRICGYIGVMYAGRVVEFGPKQRILEDPIHPYTRALLACAELRPDEAPTFIPGRVPLLTVAHRLCPFRERCRDVMEVCYHDPVPEQVNGTGHRASCHLETIARV